LSKTLIQLAGWNIQWAKTSLEPTQQLYYLGFVTDTVKVRYYTPPKKLELISELILQTLYTARQNRPIRARELASFGQGSGTAQIPWIRSTRNV
jgi:hypothetical protein